MRESKSRRRTSRISRASEPVRSKGADERGPEYRDYGTKCMDDGLETCAMMIAGVRNT